jgi:hypothetical protein
MKQLIIPLLLIGSFVALTPSSTASSVCTSRAASHALSLSPHVRSSLLHVLSLSLLELLSSLHAEGFTDYRPPTISHIQGGIIVMTNTALLP